MFSQTKNLAASSMHTGSESASLKPLVSRSQTTIAVRTCTDSSIQASATSAPRPARRWQATEVSDLQLEFQEDKDDWHERKESAHSRSSSKQRASDSAAFRLRGYKGKEKHVGPKAHRTAVSKNETWEASVGYALQKRVANSSTREGGGRDSSNPPPATREAYPYWFWAIAHRDMGDSGASTSRPDLAQGQGRLEGMLKSSLARFKRNGDLPQCSYEDCLSLKAAGLYEGRDQRQIRLMIAQLLLRAGIEPNPGHDRQLEREPWLCPLNGLRARKSYFEVVKLKWGKRKGTKRFQCPDCQLFIPEEQTDGPDVDSFFHGYYNCFSGKLSAQVGYTSPLPRAEDAPLYDPKVQGAARTEPEPKGKGPEPAAGVDGGKSVQDVGELSDQGAISVPVGPPSIPAPGASTSASASSTPSKPREAAKSSPKPPPAPAPTPRGGGSKEEGVPRPAPNVLDGFHLSERRNNKRHALARAIFGPDPSPLDEFVTAELGTKDYTDLHQSFETIQHGGERRTVPNRSVSEIQSAMVVGRIRATTHPERTYCKITSYFAITTLGLFLFLVFFGSLPEKLRTTVNVAANDSLNITHIEIPDSIPIGGFTLLVVNAPDLSKPVLGFHYDLHDNIYYALTTAVVGVLMVACAAISWCMCCWSIMRGHSLYQSHEWDFTYVPHMVTCIVLEFERGTNPEIVKASLMQKARRLASLPIADRDALEYFEGSCRLAEYVISRSSFFTGGPARSRLGQ